MQHFTEECDWWFIFDLADVDEEVTAVFTPVVKKGGGGGACSSAMVSSVLI